MLTLSNILSYVLIVVYVNIAHLAIDTSFSHSSFIIITLRQL